MGIDPRRSKSADNSPNNEDKASPSVAAINAVDKPFKQGVEVAAKPDRQLGPPATELNAFRHVRHKLKQNTPAVQVLPTGRRNPFEVVNLIVIVFLSLIACCVAVWFSFNTTTKSDAPSTIAPPPLSLQISFAISGSVPALSSTIIASFAKRLGSGFDIVDNTPDPDTPKTELLIQFNFPKSDSRDSIIQVCRSLLATDLMNIGVASAKIMDSGTITLVCSNLFVSEYCGQTWPKSGCPSGRTGLACDQCLPGRYGRSCQICPYTCAPLGVCDGINGIGKCLCPTGYSGDSCQIKLSNA